jgi:hypothetical protein
LPEASSSSRLPSWRCRPTGVAEQPPVGEVRLGASSASLHSTRSTRSVHDDEHRGSVAAASVRVADGVADQSIGPPEMARVTVPEAWPN